MSKVAFTSPQIWTDTFMLVCYPMAVACLYGGIQKALNIKPKTTWAVIKELLVFGSFVFMFWSLESYAHFRAPYYGYSTSFHDLLPRAHYFLPWIAGLRTLCDNCTEHVSAFQGGSGAIPLCVVLLESSLTYAALHTAKLLNGPVGAQPVFAGLVLVTVDALLDPIVAMGHHCGLTLSSDPYPATGNGLGLWHWYTPIASDLVFKVKPGIPVPPGTKESGQNLLALYFHIPIYNYAAWFAAPIILVSLVNLLGRVRREWLPAASSMLLAQLQSRPAPPSMVAKIESSQVALLCGVFFPVAYVVYAAPSSDLSIPKQYLAIAAVLVLSIGILIYNFGTFQHVERVDATLVLPVAFGLAIPAIAGLLTGQFTAQPWLMPVAAAALTVGLWLAWLPYRNALEHLSILIGMADRFARVHYFGFTSLLTLLGASYFKPKPSNRMLLGLLLVAMCFHVFAYVSNDVFDLELDRKNSLRRDDPLVSNLISVPTALALALIAVPISILTTLLLFDFRLRASLPCLAVLAGAYLLMTLYNWKGKRLRFPLITDLAQGLAWGSLAVFGALVAANGLRLGTVVGWWILPAYGACFIFLINGIHGGLRDLPNDQANGRFTAAILLGAKPKPADADKPAPDHRNEPLVSSTPKIIVFAQVMNVVLFGLVAYFLWLASKSDPLTSEPTGALSNPLLGVAIALVLFALNAAVLQGVVKIDSPNRNDWVSWSVFCLLLPPIAMFLLVTPPVTAFKMSVLLSFFVPLLLQEDNIDKIIALVYQNDGLKGMVARGARAVLPKQEEDEPVPALAGGAGSHIDSDN